MTENGAPGLTARLAEFAASGHTIEPEPQAVRTVVRAFADTVAVMLAASQEPATHIVQAYYLGEDADRNAGAGGGTHGPRCTVLLGARQASARSAALVNATAAHVLDFDDVALQGHPSAVLVPALLAEAQRLQASGRDVLRAYLVGYAVWGELAAREADPLHASGWHPTGLLGAAACTAAVCSLRRVPASVARHALGIAASRAAGVMANFGSMTKALHVGWAAAHGIEAADLAECGLTSSADALEHRNGLLAAASPHGRVRLEDAAPAFLQRAGEAPALTRKKFPVCNAVHRTLDAILTLLHRHDIRPTQVRMIQATVGAVQLDMLRHGTPKDVLEAKFSLPFALASALLRRRMTLSELNPDFVTSPEVRALLERIRVDATDARSASHPALPLNRIAIDLEDGRRLACDDVGHARGSPALPLDDAELQSKFDDCVAHAGLPPQRLLWERLMGLPGLPELSALRTADAGS